MKSSFFIHRPIIKIMVLVILLFMLVCVACTPNDVEEKWIDWDPYVAAPGADSTDLTMSTYINPDSNTQNVKVAYN